MPVIGSANISKIRLAAQGSDPSAPAAGFAYLYAKADGLYIELDDTTVIGPLVESGNPGTHKTQHENGGGDEISVAGLSGVLADAQTPAAHDHEAADLLSGGPITDGYRLAADGIGGCEWVAPAAIPANLDDLADVNAPTPSNGDVLTWDSTPGEWISQAPGAASNVTTITFVIDGGGSAITTGVKGDLEIPFACTLNAWTLLADASGAIKIDIWKDTYANFPPTDADSITNAHEPEIAASGVKAQDTDISDWADVTVDAGDILRFNVDSCATITRVTLSIKATKS